MFKKTNLSVRPQGMRYKLGIAFFLMSLIPLFVCVFFVLAYIYPETRYPFTINANAILTIVAITLAIALLGFTLVRQMVDPVVNMSLKAREVAEGKFDATFDTSREDEIGDLSSALNRMASRIRETINELHAYGEKTKEINIEIHQKVLTLSNLLEIGNLVSAGAALEEIVKTISEKIGQLDVAASSFVYLLESPGVLMRHHVNNLDPDALPVRIPFGTGVLGKVASQGGELVADAYNAGGFGVKELKYALHVNNLAVYPVTIRGSVVGLLGAGNSLDQFKYKPDDLETIKVFVKQLSLAVENDLLMKRAKELEMKDELTQLYNEKYVRQRLDEEIKRAAHYQRPCAFILFDVDGFKEVDELHQGELLKRIAKEIEGFVTEADRAARLEHDLFAMVIPERNKREATQLAEAFRRRFEEVFGKGRGFHGKMVTVSAGVSENPIDGTTAEELIQKAKDALTNAKSLGKNRVVA
ncbi:MAG: diguanylate cyclase [Candidatus Omnitrophota bacterium]